QTYPHERTWLGLTYSSEPRSPTCRSTPLVRGYPGISPSLPASPHPPYLSVCRRGKPRSPGSGIGSVAGVDSRGSTGAVAARSRCPVMCIRVYGASALGGLHRRTPTQKGRIAGRIPSLIAGHRL